MWAVVTLSSLAVFIILILCVPLDVALNVDVSGRPKFRMTVSWLFGLVSKEARRRKKEPEEKKRVIKGERKRREKRRRARITFEILRVKGLLSQLKRLLRDILRRLKIRKLEANLRVGLDDPADTGLLFALIGPATLLLGHSFSNQIRIQPSFDEPIFEGYLSGTVRLRPIQLIPPLMRFAFSLATMRVLKVLVLAKWKRKK